MNVAELIEILEDFEPEAEVYMGVQSNSPYESEIANVVIREDMAIACHSEGGAHYAEGTAASDVFLVEGDRVRVGSKLMWTASGR